ncbi:DUF3997 domain-containing protein [Xylanibacter ruminicola]|nr:DUF3997 domain-containing protein [Xylanibacter ruminicola]
MRKLLYIYIVLLLCGCHDSYFELGDSYIYESGRINKLMDKGTITILVPDQVLNYEFDDNYVIAYQKPDSAYYREYYINAFKENSDSTIRSQKMTDSLETLLKKMLSVPDCYWIIRKQDAKVFGPMSESDFNRMCKKLNVLIKMDKKYESRFLRTK